MRRRFTLVWVTDLRVADPAHNQPVSNIGTNPANPQAEGWCSPLVVNGRVYVGMGEGENPELYGFVYCLEAETGKVVWIFCTSQFEAGKDNAPNQIPSDAVDTPLPPGFTLYGPPNPDNPPNVVARGCSVWSAISYDETLNRIYCATGNPTKRARARRYSPPRATHTVFSPSTWRPGPWWVRCRSPRTAHTGLPIPTSISGPRRSSSPAGARRSWRSAARTARFLLIDAQTMEIIRWRQLLPYYNDNTQIPTVDPHGPDTSTNPNPRIPNEESNKTQAENFHGTYSTAAVHPGLGRLFIGVGGNNYHFIAAGIDYETTPFLRASTGTPWMTPGSWTRESSEVCQADPSHVHDPRRGGPIVPGGRERRRLIATTKVSLYAFDAKDGTPLWHDDLGMQTWGFSGGYGYCLGPAVAGDYVVAGALIAGRDGGILRIYGLG